MKVSARLVLERDYLAAVQYRTLLPQQFDAAARRLARRQGAESIRAVRALRATVGALLDELNNAYPRGPAVTARAAEVAKAIRWFDDIETPFDNKEAAND